jgi:hypothetical protein
MTKLFSCAKWRTCKSQCFSLNAAATCSSCDMRPKDWLSSFFRSILKVFGMSDRDRDTPYSVFEYPMDQIGVVPYEKHLIGSYSVDDRSYGHMKDVLVLVITHYKDDERLEHEYTVATVKEGDEGRHLKIERFISDPKRSAANAVDDGGVRTPTSGSTQDARCVESLLPHQPKC